MGLQSDLQSHKWKMRAGCGTHFSVSKKPLPLPLGEVARVSGSERVLDFAENPKYRIFALQIFDKPSQSCYRMTTLPEGEPRK